MTKPKRALCAPPLGRLTRLLCRPNGGVPVKQRGEMVLSFENADDMRWDISKIFQIRHTSSIFGLHFVSPSKEIQQLGHNP